MSLRKKLFIGALGGMVGALAMTGIRTLLTETGMISEPLPHKVERRMAMQLGVDDRLGARSEDLVAQMQHLALGATGWISPLRQARSTASSSMPSTSPG